MCSDKQAVHSKFTATLVDAEQIVMNKINFSVNLCEPMQFVANNAVDV